MPVILVLKALFLLFLSSTFSILYFRLSFQWPRNRLMSIGISPQVWIPTVSLLRDIYFCNFPHIIDYFPFFSILYLFHAVKWFKLYDRKTHLHFGWAGTIWNCNCKYLPSWTSSGLCFQWEPACLTAWPPSKQPASINNRVAELGSLSSGAKMAMKIFVKRVFIIFAANASFCA